MTGKVTKEKEDKKSVSLIEAADEIFGRNLKSKQNEAPKKLSEPGETDTGPAVTDNKAPAKDYTKSTPTATPPGRSAPGGKESRKSLKAAYPDVVADESKELNADPSEAVFEEDKTYEVGDLVEDEEGNVGKVTQITEDEIEVDWNPQLSEEEETNEEYEVGDLVEDEEGKVGKVTAITEDEIEVDWNLTEEEKEGKKEKIKEKLKETTELFTDLRTKNFNVDLKEDMDALFKGEELSEQFKTKVSTIFEAAVKAQLNKHAEELEAVFESYLEEKSKVIEEQLSTELQDYIDFIVEDWMKENEIAIQSNLRSELTEDFINGLKNLFVEHYIDVPEEEVSIVEELATENSDLTNRLNEEIEKNVAFHKELSEHRRNDIIQESLTGLTLSQAEKIKELSESVKFINEKDFKERVETLRESYCSGSVKSGEKIDNTFLSEAEKENVKKNDTTNTNSTIDKYVDAISKVESRKFR